MSERCLEMRGGPFDNCQQGPNCRVKELMDRIKEESSRGKSVDLKTASKLTVAAGMFAQFTQSAYELNGDGPVETADPEVTVTCTTGSVRGGDLRNCGVLTFTERMSKSSNV